MRLYLAFLGPYDLVAPWDPGGIRGVYHFLERVWKLFEAVAGPVESSSHPTSSTRSKSIDDVNSHAGLRALDGTPSALATRNELSDEDLFWMHKTVKKVGEDIENIKFNTAVAAMMEWLNYLSAKAHRQQETINNKQETKNVSSLEYEVFLKLLAPFAPHITEELWQLLGNSKLSSIHDEKWPKYDEKFSKAKTVTLVIQVNGKVRDSLPVEAGIDQKEAEKLALASAKVQKFLGTKKPQKVIFVPDRLINLVI